MCHIRQPSVSPCFIRQPLRRRDGGIEVLSEEQSTVPSVPWILLKWWEDDVVQEVDLLVFFGMVCKVLRIFVLNMTLGCLVKKSKCPFPNCWPRTKVGAQVLARVTWPSRCIRWSLMSNFQPPTFFTKPYVYERSGFQGHNLPITWIIQEGRSDTPWDEVPGEGQHILKFLHPKDVRFAPLIKTRTTIHIIWGANLIELQ